MKIAIWIIAICEVIRAAQNFVQIMTIRHDSNTKDNAYAEFVKSLKMDDRAYVKRILEEFEKQEGEQDGQT